jgi:hypothetical protein
VKWNGKKEYTPGTSSRSQSESGLLDHWSEHVVVRIVWREGTEVEMKGKEINSAME